MAEIHEVDIVNDPDGKVTLHLESATSGRHVLVLSEEVEFHLYAILHERRIRELRRASRSIEDYEDFEDLPAGTDPINPNYQFE